MQEKFVMNKIIARTVTYLLNNKNCLVDREVKEQSEETQSSLIHLEIPF